MYYGIHKGAFLFASELKAFFQIPGFRPEINRAALTSYLRHNYVPEPFCILEGFSKLHPGTLLEVSASTSAPPEPKPWWSLAENISHAKMNPFFGSQQSAIDGLEAVLMQSISERMVADVPLGAFLSGGIDSSVIVALMQAQAASPVRTFRCGRRNPA